MTAALKHLWADNKILSLAFLAAFVVTLFFGVRMVMFSMYWNDPAHQNQEIVGWMTPRYIAYSWNVPPKLVAEALGLPLDGRGKRTTLKDIADTQGVSVSTLASSVKAALTAHLGAEGSSLSE